jgi:hypothetical protein
MTNERCFIALDGDRVGRQVERFILSGSLDELRAFSAAVTGFIQSAASVIEDAGGTIVFAAGDSLLAEVQAGGAIVARLRRLSSSSPFAVSIGVGGDVVLAFLALKYGKAIGGGVAVWGIPRSSGVGFSVLSPERSEGWTGEPGAAADGGRDLGSS